VPGHLLIASPYPEFQGFLQQVAAADFPDWECFFCSSYQELLEDLPASPPGTVVLTDIFWDDQDYSTHIIALTNAYPELAWAVVSPIELGSLNVSFFPMPILSQPNDAEPVSDLLRILTEDLRGQKVAGFDIRKFAGQNRLGRCYQGYQPTIRRDVYLTLGSPNPTPEERGYFLDTASAMARINHPAIYSIYESGAHEGRAFFAQEPITAPTLFHLQNQGVALEPRIMAHILSTVGHALTFLKETGLTYQPLNSQNVTLAENGVVKVANTGCIEPDVSMSEQEELHQIALALYPFIPQGHPYHPGVVTLLNQMHAQSISLGAMMQEADRIELELAPVKEMPKRKETIIAQREIKKARTRFWIATGIGTVAAAAGLCWFLISLITQTVLVLPGTDFKKEILIPAGKVVLINGKEFEVPAFYIDEFETTIGQYEKFLEAVKGKNAGAILPEAGTIGKTTFIPKDWDDIQMKIRKKQPFQGEVLTKDSPIFNIDQYDAMAYAKWRGKRLPTELEWMRAAGGNENFAFPWGNERDRARANTGADMNNVANQYLAGGLDGFRGPAPVNMLVKDVSPFGVSGMGGNVCEWVTVSSQLGPLPQGSAPLRGTSYEQPDLMPTQARLVQPALTQNENIGLRLVRDAGAKTN
jgi:hypothetical protein